MIRHLRLLGMVTLIGILAHASAARAQFAGMAPMPGQGTSPPGGISNANNGPIMSGRVNVYMLFYGTFPSGGTFPLSTEDLISYFVANWGVSHSYGVLRNYTGSNGRVSGELALAQTHQDTGSLGPNLLDSDIKKLVSQSIPATFPSDPNGIYVVILGQTVNGQPITLYDTTDIYSLCGGNYGYTGYHSHLSVNGVDIKFVLDGQGTCGYFYSNETSPSGNVFADQTINALSHEIAETVTDPDLNAWGAGPPFNEVGDKCNASFDEHYATPYVTPWTGVQATAKVGYLYFSIQKLWSPTNGGGCYSGYSPPAALIWQLGNGGPISTWKMKDQNNVSAYIGYSNISGQTVLGVGDFANGIDPQILTVNSGSPSNSPLTMTTLHGDGTSTAAPVFASNFDGTAWKLFSGDFNGDGFADILFVHPSTFDVWIYFMQGATILNNQNITPGSPWLPMAVGDFNGDGLADIMWQDNPAGVQSPWTVSSVQGGPSVTFASWGSGAMDFPNVLGVGAVGDNEGAVTPIMASQSNSSFTVDVIDFVNSSSTDSVDWVGISGTPFTSSHPWISLVDVNRDGTIDIFAQNAAGGTGTFYLLQNWEKGSFWGGQFGATGGTFSDAGGWTVVGTGGFNEMQP